MDVDFMDEIIDEIGGDKGGQDDPNPKTPPKDDDDKGKGGDKDIDNEELDLDSILDEEEDQENQDDDDDDTPISKEEFAELQEQLAQKDSDYKTLQSATSRGIQKQLETQKAFKRAMKILPDLAGDGLAKITEEYEKDPQAVGVILENYFDGKTITEVAKEYLDIDYTPKNVKGSKNNPITEEDMENKKQERLAEHEAKQLQKQTNQYIGKVITKLGLTKSEAKEVLTEYNDLIEGKTEVTMDKAKKYFKMAYNSKMGSTAKDRVKKAINTPSKKGGGKKSGGKSQIEKAADAIFDNYVDGFI